ncbi:TetR/AcrR family transcriptional regulator C-terminal domain-containing protein [Actinotalea sp.]|uniref:TetR/AcrR family transcriptional regulator C-terminal domain-containing protein n=1 Tax=Actinotalea sp. TaxID=1872145 RepID=UPI00356A407C
MTTQGARAALTKDRVLRGALALADEIGVEAFTMRRLATALDVKPMTIYHHVPGKEQILDGIVDLVFAEIELPPAELGWRAAMRRRCMSAREVLNRHPWAPPLMESRTSPGPASLRHHDAVLGCLRGGGLSLEVTAHAYAILDSYVYGFTMQEAHLPFLGDVDLGELAEQVLRSFPAGAYPHFVEFTTRHTLQPGYAFGHSFEVGLDLVLDGLERTATAEAAERSFEVGLDLVLDGLEQAAAEDEDPAASR